jgi:spermidine synthase
MIIDGWFHERGTLWPGQAMCLQVQEVLYHQRSQYQDILVFTSTTYGNVLVLDGVIQVTERDEFAYQEMITHIPLYSHPHPQKVCCIGGGDGGVLREICRHASVQEIVICEIDANVIAVSKQFLPSLAIGYDDPRVTIHIGDGAQYLQDHTNAFDVIITDSSDPIGPGSILFAPPFYTTMYHALRDEYGIICTQGECMWLHTAQFIRPLIAAISTLYETVEYAYTSIPTYPSGQIGFIVATKGALSSPSLPSEGSNSNHGCHIPRRHPDATTLAQMKYYTPQIHSAAFVLPAFAQRQIFPSEQVE